jgi:hypothetical protein
VMADKIDPHISIRTISSSDSEVLVSGTADLPDGTRLRCGLWQGSWDGPFEGVIHKDTQVKVGRFDCRFEPPSRWSGTISASVELRADRGQSDRVQALIGSRGEHLAYSGAEGSDFAIVVSVQTSVLR